MDNAHEFAEIQSLRTIAKQEIEKCKKLESSFDSLIKMLEDAQTVEDYNNVLLKAKEQKLSLGTC